MTEKEITAYKKITAPSSLKERLTKESHESNKKAHLGATLCYSVAAVAAMMILVFTFFWDSNATLYLKGESINDKAVFVFEVPQIQKMRTFSLPRCEIPLEIKADNETEITVSHGVILVDKEDMGQKISISDDTEFIWSFGTEAENNGYTLEIKSKNEHSLFTVSQKVGTERFYIKKQK